MPWTKRTIPGGDPTENRRGKITTERRLIEEVSLPCRFILEHFSTFLGRLDHTVGFSWGQQFELGRGTLNNIYIHEWAM